MTDTPGADISDNDSAAMRGRVRSGVTADGAGNADAADMAAPPQLTTTEAAVRLGVSERTVRRYVERGKIEARLVMTHRGEEWHIAATDVEILRQQRDAIRARPVIMDGAATADMSADARGQGGDMRGQAVRTLTPAVVQALVTPLVAEIERLATEKGQAEGERDSMRRQLDERADQAQELGRERAMRVAAEREIVELRRSRQRLPWFVRMLLGSR